MPTSLPPAGRRGSAEREPEGQLQAVAAQQVVVGEQIAGGGVGDDRAVVEHDVLSWTHDQHTAILRALRSRDSLAAWTAATTHVTEVEAWVRAHLPT